MKDNKPVLVAGATGYVGGRLIPALLDERYGRQESVGTDIGWLFAFSALLLYVLTYFRVPVIGYR